MTAQELMSLAERAHDGQSSAWLCPGCKGISEHLPFARAVTCCPAHPCVPVGPVFLRARASSEAGGRG